MVTKKLAFLVLMVLLLGCRSTPFASPTSTSAPGIETENEPTAVIESTAVAVVNTSTPLPTSTSTRTPMPTPDPFVIETETPLPIDATSLNRAQLIDLLSDYSQQLLDDLTVLHLLIEDGAVEEGAWQEAVTSTTTAVHDTITQVSSLIVPRGGVAIKNRAIEAMRQCDSAAVAINDGIAADSFPDRGAIGQDVAACIAGINKLNSSLNPRPNTSGNTETQETTETTELPPNSGCETTSVGFVPLTELGSDLYQGMPGGLYPNGANERPSEHEAAGLALAEAIEPINGNIVILSIGMSNTRNEFDVFIEALEKDVEVNPAVIAINGAIPGRPSQTIDSPSALYWSSVDKRLWKAGLTAEDVQVIWLKQAHAYPRQPFPNDAVTFQNELRTIVQIIQSQYPNVKQVFLSSRIYAGYAVTDLSPEPYAYQAGFGVKWLIEEQLKGELTGVPWLSWGPYLWADGTTGREDGLVWTCDNFENDGTHPSLSGREQVAQLLLDFFKTDSTTRGWFLNEQ